MDTPKAMAGLAGRQRVLCRCAAGVVVLGHGQWLAQDKVKNILCGIVAGVAARG